MLPHVDRVLALAQRHFRELVLWTNTQESKAIVEAYGIEDKFDRTIYLGDPLMQESIRECLRLKVALGERKGIPKLLTLLSEQTDGIVMIQDQHGTIIPESRCTRVAPWNGDIQSEVLVQAFRESYSLAYGRMFSSF